MSSLRTLKRQVKKNSGELLHKKAIAKKLGCSVADVDKKLARREEKLKELIGGNDNE
jgi:hypothetical protein